MLDDYAKYEPIIYKQFKNALKRNLSHAYLFDLNNNLYAENMILAFVKSILCKEHINKEEYNNCLKCKRINENNYQELKKIIPDGQVIKKEQLDDLQKIFSTKPLESDKRIYIIYDVEKLNSSAANSLLKFLEEPAEGIIAILLTNNLNQVLKTIVSRCQVIVFNKNRVQEFIELNKIVEEKTIYKLAFTVFGISDKSMIQEYHRNFIYSVINFFKTYEKNKIKTILYEKEIFNDIFKEKNEILSFFEIAILFYRDIINYKLNRNLLYYDDYQDLLFEISEENTMEKLLNKITILLQKQKLVKNNVNISMLIDSMFIDMEE